MSWNLNTCGPTEEAMEKLKEYSKKTGLVIAVGTLWIYDKDKKVEGNFNNGIHRNQLTFIQDGEVVGYVGKHNVAQCDYNIEPEDRSQTIKIKDLSLKSNELQKKSASQKEKINLLQN